MFFTIYTLLTLIFTRCSFTRCQRSSYFDCIGFYKSSTCKITDASFERRNLEIFQFSLLYHCCSCVYYNQYPGYTPRGLNNTRELIVQASEHLHADCNTRAFHSLITCDALLVCQKSFCSACS